MLDGKLTVIDGSIYNAQHDQIGYISDEFINFNKDALCNAIGAGSSSGAVTAENVAYSNTISGLIATNVQNAVDEVHEEVENNTAAIAGINTDVVDINDDLTDVHSSINGLTESLTHYETGTITPSFVQGTTSLVFAENAFMYVVSGIVTFNTDVVANTFYNIDLSSYIPKRIQNSMPTLGVYAGATQIGQSSINSQGILSFRLNTTRQSGSQIGVHAFCLKKMP